jgi:hypothetical protein
LRRWIAADFTGRDVHTGLRALWTALATGACDSFRAAYRCRAHLRERQTFVIGFCAFRGALARRRIRIRAAGVAADKSTVHAGKTHRRLRRTFTLRAAECRRRTAALIAAPVAALTTLAVANGVRMTADFRAAGC